MSNRKDPSNFGTALSEAKDEPLGFEVPAGRFSIVMPERIIMALLRDEVSRLAAPAGEDDLRRFFSHFFDPMITEAERNSYVTDFQRKPPVTVLGYPRTSTKFPCFSIVMERDASDQEALGKYLGATHTSDPAERFTEYVGSMFEQTYAVYIYATHPDVCLYHYHFVKAVMIGSHTTMEECGIIDPTFDGNEMIPQDQYLPENMFVRRLGITLKSLHTVPILTPSDPARARLVGVWADDTVVGGIRGGTHAIDPSDDDG